MGGIGSGRRWHYSAHDSTSDYRSIDVRRWHRSGSLKPGHSFVWQWSRDGEVIASIQVYTESDRIILDYRRKVNDAWKNEKYPVRIDWTDCHLGGQRPWFQCPARNCNRRVAILYGGGIFACRRCYRLAYPSQREAGFDRAARRAEKIRNRLGWEPGILNGEEWKPKGMHWKTYERLTEQHNNLVRWSLIEASIKFGCNLTQMV